MGKRFLIIFTIFLFTGTFFNPLFGLVIDPNTSIEKKLGLLFANDFNTCVYVRSKLMVSGEQMNQLGWVNSACGHVFPLIISPFHLLPIFKNHISVYLALLLPLVLSYFIFIKLFLRKMSGLSRKISMFFIFSFFLSVPGFLGIYMGNVDIFLSLALGFILMYQFNLKKSTKKSEKLSTAFLGILLGVIVNAKIFLLPFALASILFTKNKFLALIASIVSFLSVTYIPRLFGSPTGVNTFLERVFLWNERVTLNIGPLYNHTPGALASYFTNCLPTQNCEDFPNSFIAMVITIIAFSAALFSKRILTLKFWRMVCGLRKKTRPTLRNLLSLLSDKYFLLVSFALISAIINIVPRIAFNYRLYYSFPLILMLLAATKDNSRARTYCYLSMIFLLIGGLWIVNLTSEMRGIIDPRLMNIFTIFHFIFLIKSSFSLFKTSMPRLTF